MIADLAPEHPLIGQTHADHSYTLGQVAGNCSRARADIAAFQGGWYPFRKLAQGRRYTTFRLYNKLLIFSLDLTPTSLWFLPS